MKKNLFTSSLWLTLLASALALNGCVFNVDRITKQISGEISSAGCTTASVDMGDKAGNITINGINDSLIKATVTVSELSTTGSGSGSAADKLTVTVTNDSGVGTMGYSFADNQDQWELLRLEDVSLACFYPLGVSAKTGSGNITALGVAGPITLETTSGNVTADASSNCAVTVQSGNIDVLIDPGTDFTRATLATTSGNIKLKVPVSLKANLSLSTMSGNIDVLGGDKTRLNGGDSTVVITCTTKSGNITIEENSRVTHAF
jgi:DUF4097 and DUF4098 domain-containing protein YvlB